MKNIITLLFILSPTLFYAQSIDNHQVKEDLMFLAEQIKQYNPALPIYHPEFDELASQLIAEANDDTMTQLQFFSYMSRLCALANEGHFLIHDWEDELHKGFANDTYSYLPIQVKVIANKLYLYGDFSDEQQLKRGDEITNINGMTSQQILEKLVQHTPSDGAIITYAHRKIEDRFNILYYLYVQQPESFEITYKESNELERTTTYKALTQSHLISNLKEFYPPEQRSTAVKDDGFYALTFDEQYATLTLPSFDFRRVNTYDVKAKKMYKTIFKELQDKNAENLIIDLRNNTGGRNEFADDIIPFITKQPISSAYFKKTISWEQKERIYKSPRVSKLSFRGRLFALVNGKTYSAGSSLARYLKEYGDAVVIGEETGTRYEGFAAGSAHHINLPNTGMEIGIPRYHILYPSSAKQQTANRGLLPNYEIEETIESLKNKTDLLVEQVVTLINQANK